MNREEARQRKRERFSAGAELADMFRDMDGVVTFAENDRGETTGERFKDRCRREGIVPCEVRR